MSTNETPRQSFSSDSMGTTTNRQLSKSELVDQILAFDSSIGLLEGQLKELKKRQSELEGQLLQRMEEEDLQGFKTEDGRSISRADRIFVTVRRENESQLFDWLDEIGRGDLVKTGVNANSLNSLIRKIIKGEEKKPLPEFLNMETDLFYKHRIDIKMGARSLRKAASEVEP